MPVEVVGLKEAMKAMKSLQPQLAKDLRTEMKEILKPVVKRSQALAPEAISGLSNWTTSGKARQISKETSMFRRGSFPKYNAAVVKAGIKSEIFPTKENASGFISIVRIVNKSAAGAIYETAGRKNPWGQPWNPTSGSHRFSHSMNPNAGLHFINSMPRLAGKGKNRGRLIFKAWDEDQGRTTAAIMRAIAKSAERTVFYVNSASRFRNAA